MDRTVYKRASDALAKLFDAGQIAAPDWRAIDTALKQLSAYLDTGLKPEEVEACKVALMGKTLAEITEFEGVPLRRMIELAKAESKGLLIVLPCKEGATVYRVERVVNTVTRKPIYVLGVRERKFHLWDLENFGKTVFLTREEAEAALGGDGDG